VSRLRITPTLAVEIQDSLRKFWRSEKGASFMQAWLELAHRRGHPRFIWATADAGSIEPNESDHANARAEWETITLAGARTYLISEDMATLAEHASATMPIQPIHESDLPTPSGIAFYERGVKAMDLRGGIMVISAFAWRRVVENGKHCVFWSYYSDPLDERLPAKDRSEYLRVNAPLMFTGEDLEVFGVEPLKPDAIAGWAPGATPEAAASTVRYMRTMPVALWSMMRDYAECTTTPIERAARRRLEKAQRPSSVRPEVIVVKLRRQRHETEHPQPGSVEWSRRWIVNGHWRRQWYATLGMHRAKWIAPFVKGPAGKPLVVSRKVHHLVR